MYGDLPGEVKGRVEHLPPAPVGAAVLAVGARPSSHGPLEPGVGYEERERRRGAADDLRSPVEEVVQQAPGALHVPECHRVANRPGQATAPCPAFRPLRRQASPSGAASASPGGRGGPRHAPGDTSAPGRGRRSAVPRRRRLLGGGRPTAPGRRGSLGGRLRRRDHASELVRRRHADRQQPHRRRGLLSDAGRQRLEQVEAGGAHLREHARVPPGHPFQVRVAAAQVCDLAPEAAHLGLELALLQPALAHLSPQVLQQVPLDPGVQLWTGG
mmetsp:Transcript_23596/g.74364  ORF Transcript_23596/g.74364 Transcript_23596/m.74364 type:complete len:271 (-) Transcript_23596:471-1283(-)